MGNDNCNECTEMKFQNCAYGDFEVINQGIKCLAMVEKKVEYDKQLQQKVESQLKLRKKMKCAHVVALHNYEIYNEQYVFRVRMYYEYIPKTLKDRFLELKSNFQVMGEREIFNIIYGVESGLRRLKEYQIRHGCINMQTIVCRSGFYKITDVSSTTYVTSYELTRKGNRQQFLSEKLLNNLACKSLEPLYELKDDLFSLGMVVLNIITQGRPSDFYKWNQKSKTAVLKPKSIELVLKLLQRNYSHKLTCKVKSLLHEGLEEQNSQATNLTDELHELEEDMSRVLAKAKIPNFRKVGLQ